MKQLASPNRLEGLDLARYVSFVGMVIVNFRIAMGADSHQGLISDLASMLEGRAAATFIVLAGIGMGLAGQKGLSRAIPVTIKRAIFLLVIGLLNMTIFDADILHYYAFYFLLGAFMLPLGNRSLTVVIICLNIAFSMMVVTLNYDAGWNWSNYTYTGFWTLTGFIRNLFFNGWHPVIPWLGFLLFGILLSRSDLLERATQKRLIYGGALTVFGAESLRILLGAIIAPGDSEIAILLTTKPIPPMPLYAMTGIGSACMTIGLCLLVSPRLQAAGLMRLVVPAGRQTLTLYIAHILLGMGTLEALGRLGGQTPLQAMSASASFALIAAVYAYFWAKIFHRGPIEALMRKVAG